MMARTRGELAIAQGPHLTAQGLLGDRDPELLPEPLDQIDQTPTHHPVHRRDRAIIDARHQGRSMRVGEPRGLARRLAVDQTHRAMSIELHDPVPHDLPRDPADPGGFGPACPIVDGRQRQQTPGLRTVLAPSGKPAKSSGIEVAPEGYRHGEPPAFATFESDSPYVEQAHESCLQRLGMSLLKSKAAALGAPTVKGE